MTVDIQAAIDLRAIMDDIGSLDRWMIVDLQATLDLWVAVNF
jgi:hypothetical protein